LSVALKKMGQGASPDEVKDMIKRVDAQETGEIPWPGFLHLMRNFYPEKYSEFRKEWYGPAKKFPEFNDEDISVFIDSFRSFDLDASGAISVGELDLAFKSMGQGMDADQLQSIIKTYDADNSGEIEWVEFLQIMSDLYKGVPLHQAASPAAREASPAPRTVSPAPRAVSPASPAASPTTASRVQSNSVQKAEAKSGETKPNGCSICGKTVYPMESINAGNKIYHKGCFKCQGEGCTLTLSVSSFTASGGQIFCTKHAPKHKATVLADGGMVHQSAMAAPKVNKAAGIQKNMRTTFGAEE